MPLFAYGIALLIFKGQQTSQRPQAARAQPPACVCLVQLVLVLQQLMVPNPPPHRRRSHLGGALGGATAVVLMGPRPGKW